MGLMDKFKEVAQKATEVWDEAAENRAKMKAEEAAGSDPALTAKLTHVSSLGSVSGDTLQALTDRSFRTVYGIGENTIYIFNEKTNMMGSSSKKLYVTEFDMFDIEEFRFDEIYNDSTYYFTLTLTDGTVYRLSCYLRTFSDSANNAAMRLEELKSWMPLFRTVDFFLPFAKEEATRQWINEFMKENGGDAVFDEDVEALDIPRSMIISKTIMDKKTAEIRQLKRQTL